MAQEKIGSLRWYLSQWKTGVLVILVAAAVWAPGPWWIYLAASILWITATDPRMVRSFLSLLATIFPPIDWALSFERRQQELAEVASGVERTLKSYNLSPPSTQQVEEFLSRPPYDTREDLVVACCTCFAGMNGIHPEVLEILYRDFHDEPTAGLWARIWPDEETKRELTRILVNSQRLPRLENLDPETLKTLILRTLDGLPGPFRLKLVQDELRLWGRLWDHLTRYAASLSTEDIKVALDMKVLRGAVDRAIGMQLLGDEFEPAAVEALLEASRQWIRGWDKMVAKPEHADDLALVHLGLFSAEHEGAGRPLAAALGCRVAASPDAHRMLLAWLWAKSQPGTASVRGLNTLAVHWPEWLEAAMKDMGPGITVQVLDVLASDLRKGEWPSQLPIQRAVAEISQQVRKSLRELVTLRKAQKKTQEWMEKVEKLYEWTGADRSRLSVSHDSIEEIKKTIDQAFKAKVHQLTPPGTSPDALPKPRSLKRELEAFVRRFPPETLPASHSDRGTRPILALTSLRERASDLGHELEEISDMLLAQAGGARAFLITFDQSRGSLADLIDELSQQEDYGLEHYTRYSRIGLLPKDATFESFYRGFVKALEEKLRETFEKAAPDDWLQIEITFQPINLLHRHELVTDAEKDLKEHVPAGAVFTKVFRIAPSGRVLQPAA